MAGFLDTQSAANQIEAIYVAYFGRAADGPGYLYWTQTYAAEIANGDSATTAATNIANSFAVQNEAKAIYSFLASPPPQLNPSDPVQAAAVNNLVETVYQNLFNRAADAGGLSYWSGQILNGQVSVGAAIYAIADGAQTADQVVLADKITAAQDFTTVTYGANLGTTTPLNATFVTAAKDAVGPVMDATTLAASEAASTAFATGSASTTNAILTTAADNVTATNIFGSLTPFNVNGIGPTLNSTDVLTGTTPPTGGTANNTLTVSDDYDAAFDDIPVGTTINNIQNVVLNTAGNAGSNAIFDTSTYPSVITTTINSSGANTDVVRAGPNSTITVNHQNVASGATTLLNGITTIGGGVTTYGGTSVTINSQSAGSVLVGSTSVAAANPTGAVVVNANASVPAGDVAVQVIGGSTVNVTDNGITGLIRIGATGSSVSSPSEPSGAVTVNTPSGNLTGAGVAVDVFGGTGVTVTASGGAVDIGDQVSTAVLFTASGNFNITDTAIAPFESGYVGLGGVVSGPTPSGFAAPVVTLGGANVSITTNTGGVTVGGTTVNGSAFSPGQSPTGTVSVTDTSNGNAVNVFGGTGVTIAASGDMVQIGDAINATEVEGPSGAVTVTDTAPLVYDGLLNKSSTPVNVIAGTSVTVTTNSGGVLIGNSTGLPGSEPTGAVSVTDTAANGAVTLTSVQVFGGTTVNVAANGQAVTVGSSTISALNPSGAVTVTQSAVESGSQYATPVNVWGGAAVTVNTTGGNVQIGQTTSPVTGAVAVTDTFVGPNSDGVTVVGGTTVAVTTTATSGNINIGSQTLPVPLNAAGTALLNPTAYSSGNVTVVNESLAGTSAAGAANVFGTGAVNVLTNGATAVSVAGGSSATITDVQTTLATGGAGANKAIGPSTLATVSLDGISGAATVTSDALANLTVADSSKAASTIVTVTEPAAATVTKALALTLNNDAVKGTTSVTDNTATSVTVTTAGTAADEFALNASKATALTFSNGVALTLDASTLSAVTSITATGAGALALGNLAGDASLASINASTATGAVSVAINDFTTAFTGGSGSDTVTINGNPGQDAGTPLTVAAGNATVNTIIANYAAQVGDTSLGATAFIRGFTTLGLGAFATSAAANYDASGFSAITLGAVAGAVTFANLAPTTTMSITASPGFLVTDILKDAKGTADSLGVTEGVDGSSGTKGIAASIALQDGGIGNGYFNLSVSSVGQGGTAANTLNVTDDDQNASGTGAALRSITISGDTNLVLTYNSGLAGVNAVSNVAQINASASTAKVDVHNVELWAGGASISGGSGLLTATGVGAVNVNTSAVDAYTTGTGGAALTLGYGGAWKGAQAAPPNSGYDKGSETVNLTGTPNASDTLTVGAGVTANNTSPGIGGVTGFKTIVGSTADVLAYAAHTVLANVGTAINISAAAGTVPVNYAADIIQVDAGVTAGATATAISEMTYKSTDGVITFGANGSNNVGQFTAQQFITAAEAIVLKAAEATGTEVIATFSTGGNTYIVASDKAGGDVDADHLYGASVVELVGTTGITSLGSTGAGGVIDTSGVTQVSALNGGSGTASTAFNDAGFSEDNLINGAAGITNTYNNLGAAAQLDIGAGADQGNLVVTQIGTAGSDSLILNFTGNTTVDSATTNSDGTLLIQVAGNTDVITALTDGSNTTTAISVTGTAGSSLTIGSIADTALTKFDAHGDSGALTLTVAQSGLTIVGALGGDTITANSAGDTITAGSATTALTGNVAITANGSGDTFSLVHSTGAATTNSIGAASGGDTFTVDGGTNTIGGTIAGGLATHALGNGDTINFLSGATSGAGINAADSVWAGGGATTVNLGTSTAAFGAGAHTDTANIDVTGDLTGATSSGSPAMVVVTGASTLGANGTLVLNFHNVNANNATLATETWAGGTAAAALVNVSQATTLAQALDLAASQSSTIDAQHGAANTQIVNSQLAQDGNTGLIDWFQFGGNTYLVDAINSSPTNTSSTAIAHTALAATDQVVELTGLVNLGTSAHISIAHGFV